MALELPEALLLKISPENLIILEDAVDIFQTKIYGYIPAKEILNDSKAIFTDEGIYRLFVAAVSDLNMGYPRTKYTIFDFPDQDLLILGAVIQSLISMGLLQMRNSVQYSENGISINMLGKSNEHLSWLSVHLQTYVQEKSVFKTMRGLNDGDCGFVGIGSDYGRY